MVIYCVRRGSNRVDQSAGQTRARGRDGGSEDSKARGMWFENRSGLFNHVLTYSLLHYLLYSCPFSVFEQIGAGNRIFFFFLKEMEAISSNERKLLLMPWIKYLSAASTKRKSTPQRKQCLNCSLLIIAGFVIKLRKKACLGENSDHR